MSPRINDALILPFKASTELLNAQCSDQVPAEYVAIDHRHFTVVKLVDGDGVKVSKEAWRDGVATAARWTHRCHQLDVSQVDCTRVFQVVPVNQSISCTSAR